MKKFRLLYFLMGLVLLSCSKQEISGIGQQGDYLANFDFPKGVLTAPAKVVITNRSKNADKFHWQFPGGKVLDKKGLHDISESDKMVPDTVYYELPGEYTVTLKTWQGGKEAEMIKKIKLEKMLPKIIVPENIAVYEDVTFDAKAFSYPGQDLTYSWDFGEGGTSTDKSPTVQFVTEGDHLVTLTVNDGVEQLTSEVTVKVKGELAKTIYFADAFTKKIYRYKLTVNTAPQVEDLGISTGFNTFGVSVKGDKLYVSETGLGTSYVGSGAALIADGYLKSFNLDGSNEKLITKPVATTLDYRDDPWMHTVDQYGNIWWTCRNWGVRVVNASSNEAVYPAIKLKIDATIAGEAILTYFYSDIKEVGNEMWVSMAGTTGKGIFKFNHAGDYIGKFTTDISKHAIRSFVVDKQHNYIYFATNREDAGRSTGIYRANIDGSNVIPIDNDASMKIEAANYSIQGAAGEYIYVTGLDIDVNADGEGYLYYGYRHNSTVAGNNPPTFGTSAANSGIKRYNLKTGVVDFLIKGYAPYGLALDQVKR